ncbi:hypothetical protein FE257_000064 [Aspergillus nanangensis]|uniref:UDP-glucose 6-dehydrogenase n=1 Tax=Aspergillus nanangensis TaxID=2582783 RepID=A0AAD4CZ25_ASPNN|nr:hypothetical protein FE257_000064 [Aspergillus nanangensis]
MPFLSFIFALAGVSFCFSRRRQYRAIEEKESSRVVVQGHTYSDVVAETPQTPPQPSRKVENVRCACIIGAGYTGALTAAVLAKQNPQVQFFVVDSHSQLIDAWNSGQVPVTEPGLEQLLFEDCEELRETESRDNQYDPIEDDNMQLELLGAPQQRCWKLSNLNFSTNVHAGIAAADMIFLCTDVPEAIDGESDNQRLNSSTSEDILLAIAQVSTGHKIIVQKSAAPCGAVASIKKTLKTNASPTASFEVLSNPDFLVPGSALQDLLYPQRVIIGHIFSEDMSPEAITALKRLYNTWVPEERIITMDAWSSELGKITASALLAQQMSSLGSMGVICESMNASVDYVAQTLGIGHHMGIGLGAEHFRKDVLGLVYLAQELGLQEVAEYWKAVLRMNEFCVRRTATRFIDRLSSGCLGEKTKTRVAIVGFTGSTVNSRNTSALYFARELVSRGVEVTIYVPRVSRVRMEEGLHGHDSELGGIVCAESLEEACRGRNAVVHFGSRETEQSQAPWSSIVQDMEPPRLFFDPNATANRSMMQEVGLEVFRPGIC